jgi:predicted short-subunit dehydrogenase-like oxidoreductase (DUF2520 family)
VEAALSTASAIVIVGSGSVAQALGRLLCDGGEPVVAVVSRTRSRAVAAASFIGAWVKPATFEEAVPIADRVLIATSDEAIPAAAESLARADVRPGIALHTCAGCRPDVLAPLAQKGVACGVLHPLQTVPTREQGLRLLPGSSFGLAGDAKAVEWGRELVTRLGGKVLPIESDRLATYHAAAVMASNALIASTEAALQLMQRAGIARETALAAIGPLSRAALDNALTLGPAAALTGPISRGDASTVRSHMQALATAPPPVRELYRATGRCLVELARQRGLSATALTAVAAALDTDPAGD